ncbi:hypothetical protein ABW19_dt0210263 [Dactylella cylindrospora]|nr:hypothetical protein ABW19_dt0210263 [Dactylella cylindrospora]
MKLLAALAAAASFGQLALAKPAPRLDSIAILEERGRVDINKNICRDVQFLVDVLKLNKATPFCSTFLGISTVTIGTTAVSTSYATAVVTEQAYATSVAYETDVVSVTSTEYVTTVPRIVSWVTVVDSTVTTTSTVTPDPSIVYTTTWTTPAAVKARSAAVKERGVSISLPPFVKKFASSAISSACGCLSLPTPSITSTEQLVQTSTVTSTVKETITALVTSVETVTRTQVDQATYTDDRYASTHVVSTVTETTTLPRATVTQVISKPYKTPYCVNILSEKKLYYYAYSTYIRQLGGAGTYPVARGEEGLSQCCQKCYDTPDCNNWNFFDFSAGAQCEIAVSVSGVSTGISAACPKGIVPGGAITGPGTDRVSNDSGFYSLGVGPCYKGDL